MIQSCNVGSVELFGYEGQINFVNGLVSIDVSYFVVDGEDVVMGEVLGSLILNWVFVDVCYDFGEYCLVFGSCLQIVGDYECLIDVLEYCDGYIVVDFYGCWCLFIVSGLIFNVGVENVFDEDYE